MKKLFLTGILAMLTLTAQANWVELKNAKTQGSKDIEFSSSSVVDSNGHTVHTPHVIVDSGGSGGGSTDGLTDTQLRATPVPVSGTVTVSGASTNGQATSANSKPVVIASDQSAIPVVGYSNEAGASFTRPADTTAYASGDLVANSTTAGSVTPITLVVSRVNDGSGMIRRVRLKKTGTSITNASFRVHFYKASPTATNGDNGAWLTTESTYLGAADVTIDKAFSDFSKGIGVPNTGSEINFTPAAGTRNIFALIEARGAYTPVSGEVFTLVVEVLQN